MTSTSKQLGGSFRALRVYHLPLFDHRFHRHDRGWPHAEPEPGEPDSPKGRWRTAGIVHFRDGEGAQD